MTSNVMVAMQSPANWWMHLGNVPLKDGEEWKTHQLDMTNPDHIKAAPSAGNIIYILQASRPVKGSIYFDRIGFMVR